MIVDKRKVVTVSDKPRMASPDSQISAPLTMTFGVTRQKGSNR